MKSKILHFVYINLCFIAFSCISDKYKETSVVPKKSSYSAATQTIEDVVIDFTNGSNEKYIMTFAMSGSQSDTSVAMILSTDKNIAKIKHTTNGSRNLVICYYAKGQIVSKDSVEITTIGGVGKSYTGNILYLRNNIPYICKSNGTNQTSLLTNLNLTSACFDVYAQNILYKNGSYIYQFNLENKTLSSFYVGSFSKIYTNKSNYIGADNSNSLSGGLYDNDLNFVTSVTHYSIGSTVVDKYINQFSNNRFETAIISYSTIYDNFTSSYKYNYYLEYEVLMGNKKTIYNPIFNLSYKNLGKVKISPDSKYVSFVEYDGSYYYLKVYNLFTNSLSTLATSSYSIDSYMFSQDASQLVFSTYNSSNSSNDLYVVNSTGGANTNITNSYIINETSVDWK